MSKKVSDPRGLIRQGDLLLVPVDSVPEGGTASEERADRFVLAEGEATGHAHVAVGTQLRLAAWEGPRRWWAPERRTFLTVPGEGARLVHEEHLPLVVPQGLYEVRRQREYRANGWAEVAD